MQTTLWHLVHKYDSPSGLVSFVIFQVEDVFSFQEGQFVMLELELWWSSIKRPYSIATTNQQMQEEKHIGFVVKKVSDDGMSQHLTQHIKMWDEITIKGPVGHYTDSETHPSYLLISTWSGLSPNVGLFNHLVYETSKAKKLINIFGEKIYADIVPELETLFTSHNKQNITNFFHLSRATNELSWFKGGHVQDSLEEAIQILWTETSCFVCWAPAMVEDVRKKLEELGVDKEDITFEKY